MDIENKIRQESEEYQIKTTSSMILQKFNAVKEEKQRKRVPLWIPITGSLAAVFCAGAVAFVSIQALNKSDTPKEDVKYETLVNKIYSLEDNSLISQAGLQLFYGSQLQSVNPIQRKEKIRDIQADISIAVKDKEERIQKNYNEIYPSIHGFLSTEDSLPVIYGKTDYTYSNQKYSYVLIQGSNRIYTKKDIRGNPNTAALYDFDGEIYKGYLSLEETDEEQNLITTYQNGDKEIIIKKDKDDDGEGLFYYIREKSNDNLFLDSEFYKINTTFEKEGNISTCRFVHSMTNGLIKTMTEYSKEKKSYEVDYFDIIYAPFSTVLDRFSYTIDESNQISYQF